MYDVYNNKPTGSESRCGEREDNKKKAGNISTGGKTRESI